MIEDGVGYGGIFWGLHQSAALNSQDQRKWLLVRVGKPAAGAPSETLWLEELTIVRTPLGDMVKHTRAIGNATLTLEQAKPVEIVIELADGKPTRLEVQRQEALLDLEGKDVAWQDYADGRYGLGCQRGSTVFLDYRFTELDNEVKDG